MQVYLSPLEVVVAKIIKAPLPGTDRSLLTIYALKNKHYI